MNHTGATALVRTLTLYGIDTIFCVPGESYLAALDACRDADPPIRVITCRHEAGAANMAEAHGKLTGRPGVCFVTRGPGATHASVGVHTAGQDSTPMLLLVGQVPRAVRAREAFQEVDYQQMFAGLAKSTQEAGSADELPELITDAFRTALSGRPGPVVLALPEDVLTEPTDAAPSAPDAAEPPPETGAIGRLSKLLTRPRRPTGTGGETQSVPSLHVPGMPAEPAPAPETLARLSELLSRARRPMVIVGGGTWSRRAARDIRSFVETNRLPVATAFRRQDYVSNASPSYAGHLGIGTDPGLARRVRDADLVLAVGTRLGDITTGGYTLLTPPRPEQTLVHVYPDRAEFGRVYEPELAIHASGPAVAAALAEVTVTEPGCDPRWAQWTEDAYADFRAWQRRGRAGGVTRGVDMAAAVDQLAELVDDDAIITNGAGNYAAWLHRRYTFTTYRSQLAPTSGAMGYGVPAAIAAKLAHPDRQVVCLAGDGCFLMTGQELATAVAHQLAVVFLVINNGMYGTIRMHQEREYPGRVVGTDLTNPDFAAYARSFGAYGDVVKRIDEFPAAFKHAVNDTEAAEQATDGLGTRPVARPKVLELRTDPQLISPDATISDLRG